MPGTWITNRQVELYMRLRKEGLLQVAAAAKSGISEGSGRSIEQGSHQNQSNRRACTMRYVTSV